MIHWLQEDCRFGSAIIGLRNINTVAHKVSTNFWQPGQSGNPAGRLRGSRNRLSEEVICALLRDFRKHGEKAVAKVRRTHPAAYLKICALLVPREHKVEHSNALKNLTDEELEAMIEHLKASIEAQAQSAKVIDGEVIDAAALPAPEMTRQPASDVVPDNKPKRPNKVMDAADTAVGARARKPRSAEGQTTFLAPYNRRNTPR